MKPPQTAAEYARRPAAALGLLAAVLAQVALTLEMFHGPAGLFDGQLPSGGQHPLNWLRGSSPVGYSAVQQAGCVLPPTAAAGQHTAEWIAWCRGRLDPCGYKIGLALACAAAPLVFALATRTLDYGAGVATGAAWIGVVVWWMPPLRTALEMGELDRLLAGPATVLHVAALHAYHRRPTPGVWLLLTGSAAAGWSLNVPLWVVVNGVAVGGWLAVGRRHSPEWHLGIILAWGLAAVASWPAIDDWRRHWWMLRPFGLPMIVFGDWQSQWWATEDGLGGVALIVIGLVGGLAPRVWSGDRRTRWLAGGLGILLLASAAIAPQSLDGTNTNGLIGLVVCLAVPAAVGSLAILADRLHWLGRRRRGLAPAAALFGVLAVAGPPRDWWPAWGPRPLRLGASAAAATWASEFLRQTSAEARVLWEEMAGQPDEAWAVLVPYWNSRSVIGGLDTACENSYANLRDGQLCGRPIAEWTDGELGRYFRRYNIGWVRCVSPAARERLSRYAAARRIDMPIGSGGTLFRLHRQTGYVLHGGGTAAVVSPNRIVLKELVPEAGVVILSLHNHRGLRAIPRHVFLQREPDVHDPIPFVRLLLSEPASRVVLEWEE